MFNSYEMELYSAGLQKDAVIFKAHTTLALQYLWPQQYYITLQSHKLRYRLKGLWHRP